MFRIGYHFNGKWTIMHKHNDQYKELWNLLLLGCWYYMNTRYMVNKNSYIILDQDVD